MAATRVPHPGPASEGPTITRRHCIRGLGALATLGWTGAVGCAGTPAPATAEQAAGQPWLAPFSPQADWQPQDYEDSQGIRAVRPESGHVVATAHLVGGHAHYSKGEIWLDLQYFPGLEGKVPLDLRRHTLTVDVEVPAAFRGSSARPNGVQVFVKDDTWKSQYSQWINLIAGGRYTATLQPSPQDIPGGHTTPGFDPARIRILGVKFGIGDGSSATYDGPLSVTRFTLTPPIPLVPPPPLPPAPPPPVLQPGDPLDVRRDGWYLRGRKWFVVGANWRGLNYGQNFGANAWFPTGNGMAKHPQWVRVQLNYMQRAGIKVVRVGLLDDGRTVLDKEGRVTRYDAIFRQDVRTLLQLAQEAQLKVEFALVDFLLAGKPEELTGVLLRGRGTLMTAPQRREEFLQAFLMPFLHEFGQHPAVLGFDVINEPEWVIPRQDGGDWEAVKDLATKADLPIPGPQMQAFITACSTTIHRHAPGKSVTVGVSAPFLPFLQSLPLDYVALHHYPWMGDLLPYLRAVPLGRPWMLEEYPTRQSPLSLTHYLDLARTNGGAGAFLWNYSPEIDESTFSHDQRDRLLQECRHWVDRHAEAIWPTPPRP